jgi:hypothetical protein
MKLLFGREPVAWAAFIAIVIQVISAYFFPLTDTQQGLLNGAVVLVLGFVTAAMVSMEKAVPALIGAIQAVVAVAIGFGAHISPDKVTVATALIAGAAALWTRTQVVAPVAASRVTTIKQL